MTNWKLAMVATLGLVLPAVGGTLRAEAQEMPPLPKPGPEHALFKEDEGAWDAVVQIFAPDGTSMTSKGVETNRIGCGGLCLITDFKGEMMPGTSFEGHGVATWDAAKKKYVGSWTDSMSRGLGISEGSWDSAARTMSGSMTHPDPTGKVVTTKYRVEYKDGTRIFTVFDMSTGKEAPMMKMTYTRRK